ncbi:hypothetical protein CRM22_009286, partial [Opisthorchis felineus]
IEGKTLTFSETDFDAVLQSVNIHGGSSTSSAQQHSTGDLYLPFRTPFSLMNFLWEAVTEISFGHFDPAILTRALSATLNPPR